MEVVDVDDPWHLAHVRPPARALPFDDGHVAAVYAMAIGFSVGAVFFNPAAQSVLPAMVRERDLVAASSGLWIATVVSQVALAPLAAATAGWVGLRHSSSAGN